jgi:hypothetical protein
MYAEQETVIVGLWAQVHVPSIGTPKNEVHAVAWLTTQA